MKKSSSSRSLKRPGSPNLSDASGTDASTRKKKHKSKHLASTQPTPGPSRPMSPANVPPNSSAPQNLDPSSAAVNKVRRRVAGSNAGSDTDNVLSDRDGGAMSDASRARQRLKLKMSASPPPGVGGTAPRNHPPALVHLRHHYHHKSCPACRKSGMRFPLRASLSRS